MKLTSESRRELSARDAIIVATIWLALSVGFALFGVTVLDWRSYHHLAQHGIRTYGQVTAKDPANHQSVRYSYVVGGTSYTGIGQAGEGNPEFDQLREGESVIVVYDPDKPELSNMGDANSYVGGLNAGILFLATVAPTIAVINMYRKDWLPLSKSRSKKKTASA
ncbi:MAG: DUF3592 domain-containing protein [Pyrinomonadaceae bacterium]